jgi:cation diffusion facilitator CzcD-associated flavoprotein CzcO
MAAALKRDGRHDFVVLERGPDIGGTWHWNTYPGCACDVPSHLYSFSFAPNPGWSQTYSRQPEIRAYLQRCADAFGLRAHLRLRQAMTSAAWDEDAQHWRIATDRGPLRARVLVSGVGALTEPRLPDVPGLEAFPGPAFHSSQWAHDVDLTGRRVAAIGTGASAIQFVPAIQPLVGRLHVVQRTAPWVMPHSSRPITDLERRLYRSLPGLQRLVRGAVYVAREALALGFTKDPRLLGVLETLARRHRERQVADPGLRALVTPAYAMGCKRILPSNHWYPALQKPNVELLVGGLREVRGSSIVTGDGEHREVDAIVFGTGFRVTDPPVARLVRGRGGRTLAEAWAGSMRAYLGTSVAGFPNLFLLLGPNTGLGRSSVVYMIESQIAHVVQALRAMDAAGAAVAEVRPDAQQRFVAFVDDRMRRTVWSTGCTSWYIDGTGRNSTLWPDFTFRFRRHAARFDPAAYELRGAPASAAGGAEPVGAPAGG